MDDSLALVALAALGASALLLAWRARRPDEADNEPPAAESALPLDERVARCLTRINYGDADGAREGRAMLLAIGPAVIPSLVDVLLRAEAHPEGLRPSTRVRIEEVIVDFGISGHLALRRAFQSRDPAPATWASLLRIAERSGTERLPELLRDPEPLRTRLLASLVLRAPVASLFDALRLDASWAPSGRRLLAELAADPLARALAEGTLAPDDLRDPSLDPLVLACLALSGGHARADALAALRARALGASPEHAHEALCQALGVEARDPGEAQLRDALLERGLQLGVPLDDDLPAPPTSGEPSIATLVGEVMRCIGRPVPPDPRRLDRLLVGAESTGFTRWASVAALAHVHAETAQSVLRARLRTLEASEVSLVRLALLAMPGEVAACARRALVGGGASVTESLVDALPRDLVVGAEHDLLRALARAPSRLRTPIARVLCQTSLATVAAHRAALHHPETDVVQGAVVLTAAWKRDELAGDIVDVAERHRDLVPVVAESLAMLSSRATADVLARLQRTPESALLQRAGELLLALAERGDA